MTNINVSNNNNNIKRKLNKNSPKEIIQKKLIQEDDHLKRQKNNDALIIPINDQVIKVSENKDRTSNLMSPTMVLTGHNAAVLSLKFDPTGQYLASASVDKDILLWNVYGECINYNVLRGHKNAILDIQWTYDSQSIVSCSADKTVTLWDATTGKKLKKYIGHEDIINSISCVYSGPHLFISGSNDNTIKCWDIRTKRAVSTYETKFPVTAVEYTKNNSQIVTGGIDGIIHIWDIRTNNIIMNLSGHQDIITCLTLSPNGNHILSNSMDSTLREWDLRSFVINETDNHDNRCTRIFYGVKHVAEKNLIKSGYSNDSEMIISGSGDRNVYIWDKETTQLKYQLPGHQGSVNEAIFHPIESTIIGSCGSDKNIFLGELVQEY